MRLSAADERAGDETLGRRRARRETRLSGADERGGRHAAGDELLKPGRVTPGDTTIPPSVQQPAWLGVAFLRAQSSIPRDRVISALTWGPYVHTEILLARRDGDIRSYAAFDGVSGFTPSTSWGKHPPRGQQWTVIRYPLQPGGYEKVYALVLQLLALNLAYNSSDLWQCCVKVALPFESDLDCERPDTWRPGGVFCSQVALLLIRRLARTGVISLQDSQKTDVEQTNSRGCSPNALFNMMTLPRQQKN
jgi:hypothetical protein